MKKTLIPILTLILILMLSGCARYYIVNVDSINNRETLQDKRYVINPGNKDLAPGDLQFQEYASYLVKVLSGMGYTLADSVKNAGIEIYLSYGVGEPESHVYSYAEPVWGQISADVNTYTTQTTSGDRTSSSSYTTVTPEYGITGYTTQTGVYTSYNKFVIIDAYGTGAKQKGAKLKHLWKTNISSAGSTKDLRKMFPILLAAGAPYIGGNTGEEKEIEFPEESESVKALKGN
jgi:hypothetical protein